jgi:hypothetical protein
MKYYGSTVVLEGTEGHPEFRHIDKNTKILSWRQVNAITPAVRRLVKKRRDELTLVQLAGVQVDGSYGSLTQLCKAIKFRDLVSKHNDPDTDFHLDFFQTVCIGADIDAGTNQIFIALSNVWMLCEIARVKNSQWALQVQVGFCAYVSLVM